MYKSGIIFGLLTGLVAAGATLISPLCSPCVVVFLGLGAGYVAGVFDHPAASNKAGSAGAISGAVAGIGALVGQAVGAAINSMLIGPQRAQQLYQTFGVPASAGGPNFAQLYWLGLVGGTICIGVMDILLMAGFGALGAYLWWQTTGKNAASAAPTVSG